MEGTLAKHEQGIAELGRTSAQDERAGEPAGQTTKSSRRGEQEVAHDLGRSFKAWLASLMSPNLYGRGGAEAPNTDDGDSRNKIVGGKGYDYCYIDPGDAVTGCNVP
jgi:hypothetical protein